MTPAPQSALVVDDHALVARIIGETLRAIGLPKIEFAIDGKHALNKLDETTYSLIIADWHMEGMGGFELLEKVRQSPSRR